MKVLAANARNIARAAKVLREGGLAIIPTETVYGVAADATNPDAVATVYEVKGRPRSNPLIVHVSSQEQAKGLVCEWTESAGLLADRFWPGPLTLVLHRSPALPAIVAGGLSTIGIRMPSHPVALRLIEAVGRPLAAPSANPFMALSATRAEHVDQELAARVGLVLDGGQSVVGLESTVVDVSSEPARILRPGGISRGEIEAALRVPLGAVPPRGPRRSPGMFRRHYAPRAALRIVERLGEMQCGLTFHEPQTARQIRMPMDAQAYGAALYDALHHLDRSHPKAIHVEAPPKDPDWEAVWDRLKKASARA